MSNNPIPVDPPPLASTISIDVPVEVLSTFDAMMQAHIDRTAAQAEFDAAAQGVQDAAAALRAAQDRLLSATARLNGTTDGVNNLYKTFGRMVADANIHENA